MFTLCMSRGARPSQQDVHHLNNGVENKQVKCGYLLRYRNGFFCARWVEEYFVLYEDSTLEWFTEKTIHQTLPVKGRVHISDAPELVAVGEWTHQVPKKPHFPVGCHIGQLIAVGSRQTQRVHWLIAQSPAEVNCRLRLTSTSTTSELRCSPTIPQQQRRKAGITVVQEEGIIIRKRSVPHQRRITVKEAGTMQTIRC